MQDTSRAQSWKTYLYWAFWVGVAFFAVYPTCNWLTAHRELSYPLYADFELSIPFVPRFFWVYTSMYILFLAPPFFLNDVQLKSLGKQLILATIISGIIFLLLPAQLGFARIDPADPFYRAVYSRMFTIDLPHNLVPSLHVIFSALIVFALQDGLKNILSKFLAWTWLALLCLSTILVHQHHLLDVASGLLIAVLFRTYSNKNRGDTCLDT